MKKNKVIIFVMFVWLILFDCIYATNTNDNIVSNVTDNIGQEYQIDSYIDSINGFVKKEGMENVDLGSISKSLLKGENSTYVGIFQNIISIFFKEIIISAKGAITIFIIVIIMALISSIELEKNSDITKISHMSCFLALSIVAISGFLDIIQVFKGVINTLTILMQTISPFMMGVLIATGAITSTGALQPMVLFLASLIGFIINHIVVPFITISLAINVICSLSESIRLSKMAKLLNSTAIWIVGICLTLFLGVLSLETSLTSSVDSLAVKTTQAAVSNFVPVVGKFFSDSFETVVGATKVIGKMGGVIGIIGIILVSAVPLIKIGSSIIIYYILGVLIEPICDDSTVSKFISGIYSVYKTLFGILVGIVIIFIISTGIILNLTNAIIK